MNKIIIVSHLNSTTKHLKNVCVLDDTEIEKLKTTSNVESFPIDIFQLANQLESLQTQIDSLKKKVGK